MTLNHENSDFFKDNTLGLWIKFFPQKGGHLDLFAPRGSFQVQIMVFAPKIVLKRAEHQLVDLIAGQARLRLNTR
jgi:hypothetical protein